MAYGSGVLHRLPLHLPLHASFSSSRVSCFTRHLPQGPRFRVRCASLDHKIKDISQVTKPQQSQTWKIKMLYDGECPLCMREVNMLRERNQAYGTINFVDISSNSYLPDENQGLDYKTVMGRIHAIQSDGIIYTDVEAFRRLYEEVGLGWVYYITKYEPISTIANAVYRIWAKYRLKITGRPSLERILESKKNIKILVIIF
ncbi:hypothetical protein HPP92_028577 [Vanilla planifolia]|uniref:Thiol-disulfide oxidoreductase DCC n=1 Tax=Vanilla planifolia TaxID=51239 RepID=A0A835U2C2_VANPL|nr:hypothetical protein HPP92_028577 [Vanilla planifolia]